jgi:hypothetical protein
MPDYQKGKIYKLWSPSKNLVYYGSTTQSISQRLTDHLGNFNRYNNNKSKPYCVSFLVLECEDYKIELVENYPCNNKQQLCKREGECQKSNNCVNKTIAGRTFKEWYVDNIDKIKQYQIDNVDKLKQYRKQYNIDNADKIRKQQKQYNENNYDKINNEKRKEYIKNYNKKYKETHKEQINEYKKQYYLKKKQPINDD